MTDNIERDAEFDDKTISLCVRQLEYKHPELNQQMTKCVSTKLKPLTVIFLDEYGQIKTKQYDDMIVEECGCR